MAEKPDEQAGLFFGQVGQTEYIVRNMKAEAAIDNIKTVATGGLGNIISKETRSIDIYDPMLTLHGMRLIYQKQSRSRKR